MKIISLTLAGLLLLQLNPHFNTAAVATNEVGELLSEIPDVYSFDLFEGLGVVVARTEIQEDEEFAKFEVRFDQLEKSVWRLQTSMQTEAGSQESVMVQDGCFSFISVREPGEKFRYGKLDFGPDLRNKLLKKRYSQMALLDAPSNIMGNNLRAFISLDGFAVKKRMKLPDYENRPVEGVEFELPIGDELLTGELHWMPDNGYLLRKIFVQTSTNDGPVRVYQNTIVEYQEIDGKLLPTKVSRDPKNGNRSITEAVSFGDANPKRAYYTAESLGLVTPTPKGSLWPVWVTLGILCLGLGFYFKKTGR